MRAGLYFTALLFVILTTAGIATVMATPLSISSITPSNQIIDNGQSITITAAWSGGTAPYNAVWYTGPSGTTCPQESANVLATYLGITGTTNAISVSPTTTNSYCVGITDSESPAVIQFSLNYTISHQITAGFYEPHGVSFSPSGTYAYVVNHGSNNVSTINTATNTVVNSITSGFSSPWGVSFSPSGTYAYVTNFGSNNVVIINTATNTVVNSITSGFNGPHGVVISPSGTYAYVINHYSSNVVIINTATNTVVNSITSGFNGPHGVAFSPSGTYAYVTNCNSSCSGTGHDNVVIINTATNTVTASITSGFSSPIGVAFSPSDTYAYVTNAGSNNVVIINTATNTVTASITSGFCRPKGVTFSPSGTYAYVANCNNVTVINPGVGAETTNLIYGNVNVNPALSTPIISPTNPAMDSGRSITLTASWTGGTPDYTVKWYTGPAGNSCSQDSANVLATHSSVTGKFDSLSVSPATANSYCAGVTDNAFSPVTQLSSNVVVTINPPLSVPTISPSNPTIDSGQPVQFTSTWTGGTPTYSVSLYSSSTNTCNQQSTLVQLDIGLSSNTVTFSSVTPSANTYYCVYVTDNPPNSYSVSNSITSGFSLPEGISFSPSGTYAYVTNSNTNNVVIINTATNTVVNSITSGFNNPSDVAFSPSGTYAYVTNQYNNNVLIINTATNTVVNSITSGISDPFVVAFSPSGKYAYVANCNTSCGLTGSDNVVIINTATNTVVNSITSGFNGPEGISISPSGTYSYVTNYHTNNVVIINTATNTVINSITSGFYEIEGVAISPSGTYAYVANYASNNVVIINTATNTVTSSITSGFSLPYGVAFSPSGTYAYVTNFGANNVVIINTGVSITNSINSEIVVNSALSTPPISPSNPTINSGQSITLTANAIGGTSPYTYNWYTIAGTTSPACTAANQILGKNANTMTVTPISTNTYAYQVVDSASTNGVACSSGDTVSVHSGPQISNPYAGGSTGFFGTLPGASTTATSTTSTVSTTSSLTSIPVTIPVIRQSTATTSQLCNDTAGYYIVYSSMNATFHIMPGIKSCINMTANNVTSKYLETNKSILAAINYSISNSSVSSNVTIHYPCSVNYSGIYPSIFRNSTWQKIHPFTLNVAACTVTFAVPADPVIALFNSLHSNSTAVNTTTSVATVAPQTTVTSNANTGQQNWDILFAVLIIIVVIIIFFVYSRSRKR